MAEGEGEGVGRVRGPRRLGQAQERGDHALHLRLGGRPVARHRRLHLVGRVLHDVPPGLHGGGEDQPAGLAHRHGGAGVDLEEQALDGHHGGLVGTGGRGRGQVGEQSTQARVEGGQPLGHGVGRRRGQDAGSQGTVDAPRAGHEPVPAPRHPGVDAQHEHAFAT
jgi:hypothetical protein